LAEVKSSFHPGLLNDPWLLVPTVDID
jgi:hypothetical protein